MKNRDSQFTRIEKSNLPYTNPYTQDLKSEKITLEDNQFCLQLRKNLIRQLLFLHVSRQNISPKFETQKLQFKILSEKKWIIQIFSHLSKNYHKAQQLWQAEASKYY